MGRPVKAPQWADASTNVVEPTSGRKAQGFDIGLVPPSGTQNWWQNTVQQWVQYLDSPATFVATTGGTTTLADTTTDLIVFTGTNQQTVRLPPAPVDGRCMKILNLGTGIINVVNSSGLSIGLNIFPSPGGTSHRAETALVFASAAASTGWIFNYAVPGQARGADGTSAAAAGYVGEILRIVCSPALALTNGTAVSLCSTPSLTLTPGVWRINAAAYFSSSTTTSFQNVFNGMAILDTFGGLPSITPNVPAGSYYLTQTQTNYGTGAATLVQNSLVVPSYTFSTLSNVTLYLTVETVAGSYSSGTPTLSASGFLQAERSR